MSNVSDLNPAEMAEYTRRIAEVQAKFDEELRGRKADLARTTKDLEQHLIRKAVQAGAMNAGVHRAAIEDVMLRAEGVFTIQGGDLVAMKDGSPLLGKDKTPISVEGWVSGLADTADHLFEANALQARSEAGKAAAKRDFLNNVVVISGGAAIQQ